MFASKPTKWIQSKSRSEICSQGYLKYPPNANSAKFCPEAIPYCLPGPDAAAKTNCITSASTSASNHWASRGFKTGGGRQYSWGPRVIIVVADTLFLSRFYSFRDELLGCFVLNKNGGEGIGYLKRIFLSQF